MLTFAIKMSSVLTPSLPEHNFLTPEELELVLSSGELSNNGNEQKIFVDN
jgi:hypothetical protein